MNTPHQEEFYEDTRYQLGHIAAEIAQLLASMDQKKFHNWIIDALKSQVSITGS